MQKIALVSVSNDLSSDQRVHKVCSFLVEKGFNVTLIGRKLKNSAPISRDYKTIRMPLIFNKGPLFYIFFNIRLFFLLLFKKSYLLVSNDLDTLPANYLAYLFKKNNKLVYDSHEYFTEAEGLTGKKMKKKIWEITEQFIFPKLKYVYTVNESIANIYQEKYKVDVKVVRNCPLLKAVEYTKTRVDLGLPLDKKIILVQGAYIDPDRGIMEALLSMKYIADACLLIIGSGRDIDNLKKAAAENNLMQQVIFVNKLPYEQLREYTHLADIGLTLDKPIHLNYKYSLPNKLFDYIHAGLPVLSSHLPEIDKVFEKFEIGMQIDSHKPEAIAEAIKSALHSARQSIWKKNLVYAALHYNWQNEMKVLEEIYCR